MDFSELKNEVFKLAVNRDSSIAAYLAVHKDLQNFSDQLPHYVRKIKAAFLSNFTLQGLPETFKIQAIFHNLWAETYLAPYGQYAQEILNPQSQLYEFKPQLIYLIIDSKDADQEMLPSLVQEGVRNTGATVVVAATEELKITGGNPSALTFDFAGFLSNIGRDEYWYTKYKELGDLRLSPNAFPLLTEALMGYAVALTGVTKKCLVVDLDNTLWRGIVGEDPFERIRPQQKLQEYILKLWNRGIILAINSRNNEDDVFKVIEDHDRMLLHKDHFSTWQINWDDKVTNMRRLAEELNLGLDSFAFIDDDPFQRHFVQAALPEVTVLAPELLPYYRGFEAFALTEEDRRRSGMYAEERKRKELQSQVRNLDDFLRQLKLKVSFAGANGATLARISQLTEKTNQFNLTTRRYAPEDIKKLLKSGWRIWTMSVQDRFGDYGIVGVAMVEPEQAIWRLDNLLLSCRVLGRGVEQSFWSFLVNQARVGGVSKIIAEFIPTAKNKPAASFLSDCNSLLLKQTEQGSCYEYDCSRLYPWPDFITSASV